MDGETDAYDQAVNRGFSFSADREAGVYRKVYSSDMPRIVAGQEQDRSRDFLRLGEPLILQPNTAGPRWKTRW